MLVPAVTSNVVTTCQEIALLCWVEAHPGMASWVQAVGTVAAIIGAFIIGQMPIWEHRRREKQLQAIVLARVIKKAEAVLGCTGAVAYCARLRDPDVTFRLEANVQPMLAANRVLEEDGWNVLDRRALGLVTRFVRAVDLLADRARAAQAAKFPTLAQPASPEASEAFAAEADQYERAAQKAFADLRAVGDRAGMGSLWERWWAKK
jgi:hypothetical protein